MWTTIDYNEQLLKKIKAKAQANNANKDNGKPPQKERS